MTVGIRFNWWNISTFSFFLVTALGSLFAMTPAASPSPVKTAMKAVVVAQYIPGIPNSYLGTLAAIAIIALVIYLAYRKVGKEENLHKMRPARTSLDKSVSANMATTSSMDEEMQLVHEQASRRLSELVGAEQAQNILDNLRGDLSLDLNELSRPCRLGFPHNFNPKGKARFDRAKNAVLSVLAQKEAQNLEKVLASTGQEHLRKIYPADKVPSWFSYHVNVELTDTTEDAIRIKVDLTVKKALMESENTPNKVPVVITLPPNATELQTNEVAAIV